MYLVMEKTSVNDNKFSIISQGESLRYVFKELNNFPSLIMKLFYLRYKLSVIWLRKSSLFIIRRKSLLK